MLNLDGRVLLLFGVNTAPFMAGLKGSLCSLGKYCAAFFFFLLKQVFMTHIDICC